MRRSVRRRRSRCRHPRARRRGARGKIQDNLTMTRPDIVFTGKGHAGTQATLESEFTVHKLFEASDKAGFLKERADKVRAIASFGHMSVDAKLMDALPKLEIIANFGVGVDQINLDDAKARKIIVTNTPDVLNEGVADTALA